MPLESTASTAITLSTLLHYPHTPKSPSRDHTLVSNLKPRIVISSNCQFFLSFNNTDQNYGKVGREERGYNGIYWTGWCGFELTWTHCVGNGITSKVLGTVVGFHVRKKGLHFTVKPEMVAFILAVSSSQFLPYLINYLCPSTVFRLN